MERCQNHTIYVYGTSARPYRVRFENGIPTCTCIAYKIGKNRAASTDPKARKGEAWCKHIDAQFDNICPWQGDPLVPGICDECLSRTDVIDEEGPPA